MEKISIIIPTLNRAHLIGNTLDSILAQIYKNWECIVVDDGSTDYTDELLEFYCKNDSRIQYHHRPKDRLKGANACRNYGFELSKGEYVNWFDSDDLMEPHCLQEKIISLFHSKDDACVCNSYYFYDDNKELGITYKNLSNSEDLLIDYLTGTININSQVILWKRSFVVDFEFNENLHRAQELDFHFRILKSKKPRVIFIDEILVFIRGHQDSITGAYKKGDLKRIKSELYVGREIIEFIGNSSCTTEEKNKSLRRYLFSLRNLYQLHPLKEIIRELKIVSPILKIYCNYSDWSHTFIPLLLIYKITGREFQLKKQLYKLKFYE